MRFDQQIVKIHCVGTRETTFKLAIDTSCLMQQRIMVACDILGEVIRALEGIFCLEIYANESPGEETGEDRYRARS